MGRLTTLKPRLGTAPARMPLARPAVVERKRGSAGVRDRAEILQRDGYLCQGCKRAGRVTRATVVDHIEPLWRGGSDDPCNKQALCGPCHDAKTASEAAERARGG